MKTFKTLFIAFLGLTSIITTVNGICADVLVDESPQTYQCGTPGIFTNSSFQQMPVGGKVLAIQGELKIDSYCSSSSPYRFAVITLDHPTVAGTKIKLFDIYWDTTLKRLVFSSQDANGLSISYYLTATTLPSSSFWYSFTAWVDFTGNVAKAHFGLPGQVTQSSSSLSTRSYPSTWTVNMNPTLYLCSDENGASSLGCQITNLKAFYKVPNWNIQLKEGSFGALLAKYDMNQTSGWVVNDSGSLGPALLGSSTATVEDPVAANKPSWVPAVDPVTGLNSQNTGLNFSNETQYVTIPTFPLAMGNKSPSYAVTFKLWLLINAYPDSARYIFRYAKPDLSANIFALQLGYGGYLQFNYFNQSLSYTSSKQLSKGYWNSIVMSYSFRPYAADGTKYYATLAALVNNQEDLSAEINPFEQEPGVFDPNNIVRIGGPPTVIGTISGVEIYNPGSTLISGSSCNPSVCLQDIGLSNPSKCILPRCHATCGSCINNLDTGCLSCYPNYVFYQGKCVPKVCGSGKYFNSTDYTCRDCISGCNVCTGPTPAECSSCRTGFWKSNGVCECVTGTYLPENSTTCASCASKTTNCYQCTQTGTCTRCYNGYLLINGVCVLTTTCPARMYKGLYECFNCSSNCAECNSLGCTTCDAGFLINNKVCYATCPSGTYQPTPTSNYCGFCSASKCDKCPNNYCQSCVAGYVAHNGQCVTSCPAGYYSDGIKCVACSSVATNCNQCNSTACLTCATNYLLYNGQCVTSCPAGTSQVGSQCVISCTANCAQCNTAGCQTCAANYLLYNGQCVSTCPSGLYSTGTACASCSSNCLQCDQSECFVCAAGYLVYNGECVSACPTGTYAMCAVSGF